MLFNRSFYFFQFKITSKTFSKLAFFHNFNFFDISKISINFFFPKVNFSQDLRLIISFFLLVKIFSFKPYIYKFNKFIFEDESTKQMHFVFFQGFPYMVFINFCFLIFFLTVFLFFI